MDILQGGGSKPTTNIQHDPNYLTLSRMLSRYQNLILLTPLSDEKIETRLRPWQQKVQAELRSPLPFHRMQWLRNIEGARTLLLKLEQSTQGIKVQRTRREVVKELAEKRMIIKRLRSRVEQIGREVDAGDGSSYISHYDGNGQSETMHDVLMQIRQKKGQSVQIQASEVQNVASDKNGIPSKQRFEASPAMRQRRGPSSTEHGASSAIATGSNDATRTEDSLLDSSREHEDITTSLVNMAAQLKQQARQFQFTLDQDKNLIDRAMDGLEGNFTAMTVASKGMKSLQRMSEEQGWLGRLKLHAMIFGLWAVAILLVFAGPKLRF